MKLCKDAQTTQLREYRTQRVPGQKNGVLERWEIRANPTKPKSGEWVDANIPILPVNFEESVTAQVCFTPVSYRCASTAQETTQLSSWLPVQTYALSSSQATRFWQERWGNQSKRSTLLMRSCPADLHAPHRRCVPHAIV
ncbi:hypothetical protein Pla52o_47150 [Novipirellula galeiformis]|uniref:Uncharacterized protein n=1 Tax=Novipirellula galeiformis TaxID=2528004 RepID=A0A5C6C6F3_9BACT|nr:hypothetical protein Pla52o_47150 [Novipirellula galeiformis]